MKFKFFLCNVKEVNNHMRLNWFNYVRSLFLYLKMSNKYYNCQDFSLLHKDLKQLRERRQQVLDQHKNTYNTDELLSVTLDFILVCRFLGYLFHQSDLCLNRSYALAYALTSLGIPCNLIIGRANYYLNRRYQFHAWVEVLDVPINDRIEVKTQWERVWFI